MFTGLRATFKDYPTVCSKPHLLAVNAYQIPATEKNWEAVAIAGHGLCYCSMSLNCRFWIFRIKNGKLSKVFKTNSASSFGFLPSRSGIPLLVVWTRESAMEQFAIVYKYEYGEYVETASWKEVYEYEDKDEEYRVHNTPRIYSDMPLGFFLPD